MTKEQRREYSREYRRTHKDEIRRKRHLYYLANRETINKKNAEYHRNHPEQRRETVKRNIKLHPERRKIAVRKYYLSHKEQVKEYYRKYIKRKRNANIAIYIGDLFANSIRDAIRDRKNNRHWETLVGYTLQDLMRHLESQFDNKMNWDNYGSYWVIDHIKPRSLFHYETAEDPEFKKCWALGNLQPMEKIANIKKSNHFG